MSKKALRHELAYWRSRALSNNASPPAPSRRAQPEPAENKPRGAGMDEIITAILPVLLSSLIPQVDTFAQSLGGELSALLPARKGLVTLVSGAVLIDLLSSKVDRMTGEVKALEEQLSTLEKRDLEHKREAAHAKPEPLTDDEVIALRIATAKAISDRLLAADAEGRKLRFVAALPVELRAHVLKLSKTARDFIESDRDPLDRSSGAQDTEAVVDDFRKAIEAARKPPCCDECKEGKGSPCLDRQIAVTRRAVAQTQRRHLGLQVFRDGLSRGRKYQLDADEFARLFDLQADGLL